MSAAAGTGEAGNYHIGLAPPISGALQIAVIN